MDDEEVGEFEGQNKQQQQQEMEKGDPNALLGSHAAQVGGANEHLYDQFSLHSSTGRKHQILLLEVWLTNNSKRYNYYTVYLCSIGLCVPYQRSVQ